MANEIWKTVVQYTRYEVSNLGRVRNRLTNRVLKAGVPKRGYPSVFIRQDGGTYRMRLVHRLVAEAFIPNPRKLPQVNHLDGVKGNNALTNLEWTTCARNCRHARAIGLIRQVSGEEVGAAKLTEEQVREVRRRYASGLWSQRELGKFYEVSHVAIGEITRYRNWRGVA